MKIIYLLILALLSGCSSQYSVQKSSLSVDDRINVMSAKVSNPYPECDVSKESRRIANLSIERSERVYLQEGKLCQRAD